LRAGATEALPCLPPPFTGFLAVRLEPIQQGLKPNCEKPRERGLGAKTSALLTRRERRAPTAHAESPVNGAVSRSVLLILCWTSCAPLAAAELKQSFRGQRYDVKLFRTTGTNIARAFSVDPEGLRITLPPEPLNKLPVGLIARTGVRGDFEITMAFDVLKVDKPTKGGGAGLGIYITTISATNDAASISRLTRPGGERAFVSHHAVTPRGGNRVHRGGDPWPTDVASGRLRLVRKGSVLTYLAAKGGATDFRELYQVEFGADDLETIRFAADNNGSPTLVDVRIKSISIQADELGSPRREPPRRPWPIWQLACLVAALGAGVGYYVWRRRRM
jgi:hypothetical protein